MGLRIRLPRYNFVKSPIPIVFCVFSLHSGLFLLAKQVLQQILTSDLTKSSFGDYFKVLLFKQFLDQFLAFVVTK